MRASRFTLMLPAVLLLLPAATASSDEARDARETLRAAEETFARFALDPELDGFRRKLREARGVMVLPKVVKAGFIFGGSGGRGVLVVHDEKRNDWSPPAFYTMGSGSVGLQIGAQVSEVVLLVMSRKGIDALLSSKVQFGGDVSVAAGPVGTGLQSANADVLGYLRSEGAFAGASLESAYVDPDDSRNAAYYDRKHISPVDIIIRREVEDEGSRPFRKAVAERARNAR